MELLSKGFLRAVASMASLTRAWQSSLTQNMIGYSSSIFHTPRILQTKGWMLSRIRRSRLRTFVSTDFLWWLELGSNGPFGRLSILLCAITELWWTKKNWKSPTLAKRWDIASSSKASTWVAASTSPMNSSTTWLPAAKYWKMNRPSNQVFNTYKSSSSTA